MANKKLLSGTIELTKLNGIKFIVIGQDRYIAVPVDANPAIEVAEIKDERRVFLGLTAFENDAPDKFGNSHSIKLHVGKKASDKLGLKTNKDRDQFQPYVGNWKTFEFQIRDKGEDLPPDIAAEIVADDLPSGMGRW